MPDLDGGAVRIDEVALFDRVLTEREIRRLYQLGKSHRPLKK